MRDQDFEHHEHRLRQFLVAQHPGEIFWSFREDYIWIMPTLYFKSRSLLTNRELSRTVFDSAPSDLGVELRLVATCGRIAICTIHVPPSPEEAELRMIRGVKLCIPYRLPHCETISDPDAWDDLVSRSRGPRLTPVDDLMRRAEVVAP